MASLQLFTIPRFAKAAAVRLDVIPERESESGKENEK